MNISALKVIDKPNNQTLKVIDTPQQGTVKVVSKLNTSALIKPSFFTPTPKLRIRDVVREFGTLAKDIGQEISRNIGSAGITLAKPIGKLLYKQEVDEVVVPDFLKGIFKDEPVKSIERRIADAEIKVKKWGQENRKYSALGRIADDHPFALAFAGVMGSVTIDLAPFGGTQKGIFQAIKKTDNVLDALKLLTMLGVEDNLAKEFAEEVIKTKTDDVAKKLLTHIAEVQRTTKPAKVVKSLEQQAAKDFTESFNKTYNSGAKKIETETALDIANKERAIKDAISKERQTLLAKAGLKEPKSYSSQDIAEYNKTLDKINKQLEIKYAKISKVDDVVEPIVQEAKLTFIKGTNKLTPEGEIAYLRGLIEKNPLDIREIKYITGELPFPKKGMQGMDKTVWQKALNKADSVYIVDESKGTYGLGQTQKTPLKIFEGKFTDFNQRIKQVAKTVEAPIKQANLPAVIQGDTFTLGTSKTVQPTKAELITAQKLELKATKLEIKNADIANKKALKLEVKQQKVRTDAIENIQRHTKGSTKESIAKLKTRNLSDEDIANIILEDGIKLVDTVAVKRNADNSLAVVIKKSDIEDIAKNYTDEIPKAKWTKKSKLVEGIEVPIDVAKSIELPYVWFERKGLSSIFDPIIEAGRDAETLKTLLLKRFQDVGLFKKGGWFTADRFTISKRESEHIGKYYLSRQGKGGNVALTDLSQKEKSFVEIFDGIIKDTEKRFYAVAKTNGKTPNKVKNYAPIMTKEDIKLTDQVGSMDWLFRNHPAFFSLKERVKRAPLSVYETDYRVVAANWLDGITDFLNYGETTPKVKYLLGRDEFKNIVKESDTEVIHNWLKNVTTQEIPKELSARAVRTTSRFLRKGVAIGSLGLNYSSVAKQALTHIPILIINKVRPKLASKYAKAFGISVKDMPSLTKRSGDIAIKDLQGKIGRIFTGSLTEFDRRNAQLSLNGLLDKEYKKFLKAGANISPEVQHIIEKKAQDALDMWYGGFFKGQRPEAFRKELGNFILMFLYPLTSQLNGFYRHILTASGVSKVKAGAEVLAAATAIAYMEQTIERLSPKWSDEKQMTQDVLQSLTGNIPLAGNLTYAILNKQEFQVSPVMGNFNAILRNASQGEGEKTAWSIAETFGVPKQIRRIKEGMEIMEEGGITDDKGKMLAPVQDAMELVRSFLRGKYGSIASQDWVRNIGEKKADRRWFVPEVEFLQNGDYTRKAELYKSFDKQTQTELRNFLSEAQQKRLDNALGDTKKSLNEIFSNRKPLNEIFK